MKVLVAVGSKYGATREIGDTVAEVLRGHGLDARCENAFEVESLEGYDAVVLGSAVYGGFWRRDAKELLMSHREALRELPVWLFSSGPVGLPPRPLEPAGEGEAFVAEVHARGHVVFGGYLNPDKLNFGERAVIRGLRAAVGDYRDWGNVKDWAREVAHTLVMLDSERVRAEGEGIGSSGQAPVEGAPAA